MKNVALIFTLLLGCASATADEIQYGQFEVTMTAAELLDPDAIDTVAQFMDVNADIVWSMYVPETYDATAAAGVMVYISPSDKGWTPRGWRPVLDDRNLIWISANDSGNETIVAKRMIYAVLAPQIVAATYKVDTDRVYVSGFSGGSKMAGMVAIDFAHLFKGAIYVGGAEYWLEDESKLTTQVMNNRYVFITGSEDFNRDLTYKVFYKYEDAEIPHIDIINVARMAHTNPGTRQFRQAVEFLDQRE